MKTVKIALNSKIEQIQSNPESWFGDDLYLFEGAYGELLKEHSAEDLFYQIQLNENFMSWSRDLLSRAAQAGRNVAGAGIEAGKNALMNVADGIKKFGQEGWNILSSLFLIMKSAKDGDTKLLDSWKKSILRLGPLGDFSQLLRGALKYLVAFLTRFNMPTFAKLVKGALDFVDLILGKIKSTKGWESAIVLSGISIGMQWLKDEIGEWLSEFRDLLGDDFNDAIDDLEKIQPNDLDSERKDYFRGIKNWLTATLEEKIKKFGTEGLKKIIETLATTALGVGPWWEAAKKVGKGIKTIVDALGGSANRFIRLNKAGSAALTEEELENIIREAVREVYQTLEEDKGDSTMKITQQELSDIIREELTQIDFDAPPSEEETRMDKLAGMIEGTAMAKMDEVISMISNHLVTTMGEADDRKLVSRALEMLEELGFKELKPEDAEKMIKGDEE